MKGPIPAVALGACLLAFSSSLVLAARNPSGTGMPNQTCQDFGATVRPGNSASSPGSVFNEPMQNSPSGGTGGAAYNAAGAPSQYDVACFQQFSKPQVP
jgi:hypothetical protein